jgi:hypothetical protein
MATRKHCIASILILCRVQCNNDSAAPVAALKSYFFMAFGKTTLQNKE